MAKKCFVISPIGDEGTAVREEADTLLDLVITPALEPAGFEVIRIDRLKGAKAITSEIIQLIQEADLCVIVLTGHNPNVYYEMGRRHETGKPYIHLIRKGEPIPFDIAPIRTIMYDDISQSKSAFMVQRELASYVKEIEESNVAFGPSGTGVSLATLSMAVDRIERRLSQLSSGVQMSSTTSGGQPDFGGDPFRNPWEIFREAMDRGDLATMVAILPRIEMVFGPADRLLYCASIVAQAGVESGADIVFRLLTDKLDTFKDIDDIQSGLSALVSFYEMGDREMEALSKLEPMFNRVLEIDQIRTNPKYEAYFLNQLQKLYFGSRDFDKAISIGERVVKLAPDDASYAYNLSMNYELAGKIVQAVEQVDRLLTMSRDNPLHLGQAVDVYVKAGRHDDARTAYERLSQLDPARAKRVMGHGNNAKVLSIR